LKLLCTDKNFSEFISYSNNEKIKLNLEKIIIEYGKHFTDHICAKVGAITIKYFEEFYNQSIFSGNQSNKTIIDELSNFNININEHMNSIQKYFSEFSKKDLFLNIPIDLLLAARLYTLRNPHIYSIINNLLRDLYSEHSLVRDNAKEKLKNWNKYIDTLQRAIYLIPGFTEDVVVYKPQNYLPPNIMEFKRGYSIVWPVFTICSTDQAVCKELSCGKVLYYFKLPKNQGANLEYFSLFPSYREILLPINTKFSILNIYRRTKDMDWLIELSSPQFPVDLF